MSTLEDYLAKNGPAFEDELCELLRIASVSADSRHRADIQRAAEWLLKKSLKLGLSAQLHETPGNPILFAAGPKVPGAPTVLVYGHYDVQPPDPLGEWISPPFEPARRGGNLFARGATDDKGQVLTHVFSAQAWLAVEKRLPVNLKFLIEGEEEIGSAHLDRFVAEHRDLLACDVVVISDTAQFGPGLPAITFGLRGIAYFELELVGPSQDLHSGIFGGAVTNPANALCRVLSSLIDNQGRVQVPGFYDQVLPLSPQERAASAELPFDEPEFMRKLGVEGLTGEVGYTTLERKSARPTFDINGLTSGYQGEGAKTVLPARASAKFSFRLVPDQDPKKIALATEDYLRTQLPPGIRMKFTAHHGAPGVVTPIDSPFIAAAARAIEQGFGKAPLFMREGGSIPVVNTFHEQLKVDTLLLGWGQNDDNAHSPNEKFCLADFHRGIRTSAALWRELAAMKRG